MGKSSGSCVVIYRLPDNLVIQTIKGKIKMSHVINVNNAKKIAAPISQPTLRVIPSKKKLDTLLTIILITFGTLVPTLINYVPTLPLAPSLSTI